MKTFSRYFTVQDFVDFAYSLELCPSVYRPSMPVQFRFLLRRNAKPYCKVKRNILYVYLPNRKVALLALALYG